ncbi:hypothetical protein FTO70_06135 [Methanosarcina sp. KYL-1]|uniref:hypothetical protein n=1 Tax=Methanosarcina sp. KYL-1 TaxID=2602068 RepID=UPI002100D7D5|nr:hypothetical protein [Methanosarcina sp. KYL-1]MCQ1535275.1 hypothetical protein [Methanosarcina sp. KYL-1]
MAWDDIVFGIATGGLYNIGKAAYKAGNAADSAGKAAEEAGMAIAVIGSTLEAVGEQLNSLLAEAEELITIRRMSPRDEDELWEEEKERLSDLREEKQEIEAALRELGVEDAAHFSFDFWDMLTDWSRMLESFRLLARLAAVNTEITEILYQEPGVLTQGIYSAKEVLERFNTLEQPRIEDILDSVDDNLEVSEEVLKEVKKLFVTRRKVLIPEAGLSPAVKEKLERLKNDREYFEALLGRKDKLALQFADAIKALPEKEFEINSKWVKLAEAGPVIPWTPGAAENVTDILEGAHLPAGPEISGPVVSESLNSESAGKIPEEILKERPGETHAERAVEEAAGAGKAAEKIAGEVAGEIAEKVTGKVTGEVADRKIENLAGQVTGKEAKLETRTLERNAPVPAVSTPVVSAPMEVPAPEEVSAPDLQAKDAGLALKSAVPENVSETAYAKIDPEILKGLKFSLSGASKISARSRQPQAARISASLNTKFDGFQKNLDYFRAQTSFYERQVQKFERRSDILRYRWEEEPGLIPQTLEEVHGVLEHLRTKEQARIDAVLDNLNETLEEVHGVLEHLHTEEQARIDTVLETLNENLEEAHGVLEQVRTGEQPKVDAVLDTLNENLEESRKALSKVNESLETLDGSLTFFKKNAGMIQMGLLVFGGLVGLNLFFGLIVLFRMAIGL